MLRALGNPRNVYNSIQSIALVFLIGLSTVFDAILTGRRSVQKLECLYGNPVANNFFQN